MLVGEEEGKTEYEIELNYQQGKDRKNKISKKNRQEFETIISKSHTPWNPEKKVDTRFITFEM